MSHAEPILVMALAACAPMGCGGEPAKAVVALPTASRVDAVDAGENRGLDGERSPTTYLSLVVRQRAPDEHDVFGGPAWDLAAHGFPVMSADGSAVIVMDHYSRHYSAIPTLVIRTIGVVPDADRELSAATIVDDDEWRRAVDDPDSTARFAALEVEVRRRIAAMNSRLARSEPPLPACTEIDPNPIGMQYAAHELPKQRFHCGALDVVYEDRVARLKLSARSREQTIAVPSWKHPPKKVDDMHTVAVFGRVSVYFDDPRHVLLFRLSRACDGGAPSCLVPPAWHVVRYDLR